LHDKTDGDWGNAAGELALRVAFVDSGVFISFPPSFLFLGNRLKKWYRGIIDRSNEIIVSKNRAANI